MQRDRHAILITGMHRSGTSALARVLNLAGAALADDLLPARADNPTGYWESAAVVRLNDACLQHFGRAWDDPRALPAGWEADPWTQRWRAELRELLARDYADAPLWLVKDPRIARLLPAWLAVLDELDSVPHVVITLRHPRAVAESLARRAPRLPRGHAERLWLRHVLAAEADSRAVSRAVLHYGELLDDWRHALRQLGERLRLVWPNAMDAIAGPVEAFLDPSLQRQRAPLDAACADGDLAGQAAAVYAMLAQHDGSRPDLRQGLDGHRAELETRLAVAEPPDAASPAAADAQPKAASMDWWLPPPPTPIDVQLYQRPNGGEYRQQNVTVAVASAHAGAWRADFPVADAAHAWFRFDPGERAGIYRLLAVLVDGVAIGTPSMVSATGGVRLDAEGGELVRFLVRDDDPWVELDLRAALAAHRGPLRLGFVFQRDSLLGIMDRRDAAIGARLAALQRRHDAAQARLRGETAARQAQGEALRLTLEHLRQARYANLLASQAAAGVLVGQPRGGLRLAPQEGGGLRLLARQPGTALHAWENTGDEPFFSLRWADDAPLAAGWYVLRIGMLALNEQLLIPKLYLDVGDGFNERNAVLVGLTPGTVRQRPLLRFQKPVRALRLCPVAGPVSRAFILDHGISLRRVTRAEVILRLGLPAVRRFRAMGASWPVVVGEVAGTLRHGGAAALDKLQTGTEEIVRIPEENYARWVAASDTLDDAARQRIREAVAELGATPLISIVMPVYNTPERWLRRCLDSVLAQLYPHWQLCIADDASSKPQVRRVLEEYAARDARIVIDWRAQNGHICAASNSALALAEGPWVALLDHDDELAEEALYEVARAIEANPDAQLIYSDEDKINEHGRRYDPYFKPDWNPLLFCGHNLFSHLGVYRRALMQAAGGFRAGTEGSQDYDLAFRCMERVGREHIVHIPRVLYHWRAIAGSTALAPGEKNYAHSAARQAINAHLERVGAAAEVSPVTNRAGNWQLRYRLPDPPPSVTLIIPTRDGGDVLRACLASIERLTDYPDYRLLVIDNRSSEEGTLQCLAALAEKPRCRVRRFDEPFNFARLNNAAVAHVDSDIVVFLNDDTEVINRGWLRELVALASLPDVGAVGAMLYHLDDTIQHAGIVLGLGADRIAGHAYFGKPRGTPGDKCRALLVQEVSAVTAACMAVRRATFEAVGGFDTTLAVAFNDVDLCLRLAERGFHNVWTPNAELYHRESFTRGTEAGAERGEAYARECRTMRERWGERLLRDPYYHPALSLDHGDFTTYRPAP